MESTEMTSEAALLALRAKLEKCWSEETAHPDWQCKWTKKLPSLGQCYVTSLIVQDLFGGRLMRNKHGVHIWNRLPNGVEVDLTTDQLGGEGLKPFYEEMGILLPRTYGAKRSNARYKLLKRRLEALR